MKKLLTLAALLGAASLSFGQGYVTDVSVASNIKTNNAGTATGNAGAYNGAFSSASPGPGVSWYYELLAAPTTQTTIDATLAGWTPFFTGSNSTVAGRMDGRNSPDGLAVTVNVLGASGTSTLNFAVVGWSANLGSDYSAVFSGRPTTLVSGPGNGTTPVTGSATWSQTAAPAPAGWTQANMSAQLGDHAGQPGGFYGISNVGLNVPLGPNGGPYNDIWAPAAINSLAMNYYTTVIPEPATFALAGLGAAALLIFRRRK